MTDQGMHRGTGKPFPVDSTPSSPRRWPTFLVIGLMAVIGLGGLSAYVEVVERNAAIETAKTENLASARVTAERLSSLLLIGDAILRHIAEDIARGETHNERLEAAGLISAFSEFGSAQLINRRGDLIWATESEQTPRVNYADQPYFKEHRAGSDFLVSDPVIGLSGGKRMVVVSRALKDSAGRFDGIMLIAVETGAIEGLLRTASSRSGAVSAVWRRDGTLLTSVPPLSAGLPPPEAPPASSYDPDASGSYVVKKAADGDQRLVGYSAVRDCPLVVTVAIGAANALVGWQINAICVAFLNIILAATLIAAGWRDFRLVGMFYRSGERSRLLLRHASDGIHILDEKGTLIEASDSFCRMLGYDRAEMIGMNVAQWDVKFPAAELADLVARQFETAEISTFETVHRRKDGGVFDVEVTGHALLLDGRPALYNSSRDITERKRAEADLTEAKLAAEKANIAKSIFLANMSHELRTPLTAVIGFAELIETEILGPIEQRPYVGYAADISAAGRHLLDLINDVLDISKIEARKWALSPAEIGVADLIGQCLRLVEVGASSGGIELRTTIAEDLPPVVADPRALKQAVLNLLSNAVKFTPKQGSVTVSAWREGGILALSVTDTGIGIPAEEIPRLMRPFEQIGSPINRKHPGTGLGLALTKALVELHGGRVEISSTPGTGTTVTLRIPLEGPAAR